MAVHICATTLTTPHTVFTSQMSPFAMCCRHSIAAVTTRRWVPHTREDKGIVSSGMASNTAVRPIWRLATAAVAAAADTAGAAASNRGGLATRGSVTLGMGLLVVAHFLLHLFLDLLSLGAGYTTAASLPLTLAMSAASLALTLAMPAACLPLAFAILAFSLTSMLAR